MKIRRFTQKQTFQWIGCGLRFWKRRPIPWLLTGLLLSILSLVVLLIPLIGVFFFAFFSPVIYASMFVTLNEQLGTVEESSGRKSSSIPFPVFALFRSVLTEQGALVMFIPGTVAFVTALAVQSLLSVVGGPFVSLEVNVFDIGFLGLARLAVAYLLAYLVYVILMAKYFYIVPLCLRDDVSVKTAFVGGFDVARKNLLVVSLFLAALFSPMLVSVFLIHASQTVGIAAWLVAGTAVFPLAVHCAYCGNRLTFVNR